MDTEPCTDLERVPSSDGKSSNDRFRCLVCVEYGSDDESKSFTQNNKSVHLRTTKHRLALNCRTLKLGEKPSAQPQCEQPPSQPISALLPLPEIPLVLPNSQDDMNSDVFRNFRHLGLTYLDENGEQLEFSAGTVPNGGGEHISALGKKFHAVAPEDLLALVGGVLLFDSIELLTACRIGPTHMYENQCSYIQKSPPQLASHGRQENGVTRSLLKSYLQCGQTGREPQIAISMLMKLRA